MDAEEKAELKAELVNEIEAGLINELKAELIDALQEESDSLRTEIEAVEKRCKKAIARLG